MWTRIDLLLQKKQLQVFMVMKRKVQIPRRSLDDDMRYVQNAALPLERQTGVHSHHRDRQVSALTTETDGCPLSPQVDRRVSALTTGGQTGVRSHHRDRRVSALTTETDGCVRSHHRWTDRCPLSPQVDRRVSALTTETDGCPLSPQRQTGVRSHHRWTDGCPLSPQRQTGVRSHHRWTDGCPLSPQRQTGVHSHHRDRQVSALTTGGQTGVHSHPNPPWTEDMSQMLLSRSSASQEDVKKRTDSRVSLKEDKQTVAAMPLLSLPSSSGRPLGDVLVPSAAPLQVCRRSVDPFQVSPDVGLGFIRFLGH
ncbi:uncharacterized protein LOC130536032 isoform X2 [Takifugu flavidus]|uniref:uncharacterized protein LOC130536032 isoform X2 n=1 Tax=Takifugu flavidus TaxID=433684 RepID=UPI0025447A3C|nr:uncharacterized protein LOC130536032 isoform X2 [Takifugu flavidus]